MLGKVPGNLPASIRRFDVYIGGRPTELKLGITLRPSYNLGNSDSAIFLVEPITSNSCAPKTPFAIDAN